MGSYYPQYRTAIHPMPIRKVQPILVTYREGSGKNERFFAHWQFLEADRDFVPSVIERMRDTRTTTETLRREQVAHEHFAAPLYRILRQAFFRLWHSCKMLSLYMEIPATYGV